MRKLNKVIVLLYIFLMSLQKFENTSRTRGLETRHTQHNNLISAADIGLSCQLHTPMYTVYQPIIVTLMYNIPYHFVNVREAMVVVY